MAAPPRRKRPRYIVVFFLGGGMDAVSTTDPKTRSEVESWVDVPYAPNEIVSAGGVALGPYLKSIASWVPHMAIVNGVRVSTANHQTGFRQFVRFKTNVSTAMPVLLELIGAHREGQPLSFLQLGGVRDNYSCNKAFVNSDVAENLFPSAGDHGHSLLDYMATLSSEEASILADTLRTQAKQLSGSSGSASSLREAADLFEAVARAPHYEAKWSLGDDDDDLAASGMQRTLWALENDLTCGVLSGQYGWDTHDHNSEGQEYKSTGFFRLLDRFLGELATRTNRHGRLADNTLIVIGSELGRNPRLNARFGKDHFPEAPFLLLGAGVRTGGKGAVYGRTGTSMQSLPVSIATGAPGGPREQILTLDDLGATILHIAGLPPGPNGYDGKVLDFLVEG